MGRWTGAAARAEDSAAANNRSAVSVLSSPDKEKGSSPTFDTQCMTNECEILNHSIKLHKTAEIRKCYIRLCIGTIVHRLFMCMSPQNAAVACH